MSVSSALSRVASAAWRAPTQGLRAFCYPRNHLARFTMNVKNVDKCIKTTKVSSDLVKGILQSQGLEGGAHYKVAANISSAMGDARSVVALTHTLRGIVPSCVGSIRSCYGRVASCMDVERRNERRLHATAAFRDFCNVVNTGTFIATFGALRPVLFANKMADRPFLSSSTKNALGHSVVCIMAAGHAAATLGGIASLCVEQMEFSRDMRDLWNDEDKIRKEKMMQKHRSFIVDTILTIVEKSLELAADAIKLLPLGLSSGVQLASSSACVLASCCVGLFAGWRKS